MKGQVFAIILLSIIYLIGISIWSGMYFWIYYPFEKRDYRQATCEVIAAYTYTWLSYDLLYDNYYLYYMKVEINDTEFYTGFACESSAAEGSSSEILITGKYPYEYSDCRTDDAFDPKCFEDQIFLPLWTCKLNNYASLYNGQIVPCKWWLHSPDGETDPGNVDLFESYPKEDENFIEVLLNDEVFFYEDEYNAMWVIAFGFLVFGSLLGNILTICLTVFCCRSQAIKNELKDTISSFFMCRKRKINSEQNQAISCVYMFLYANLESKKLKKFPSRLVKNTVKYMGI